ncbi:MAG: M3 family oligoendopeptidase [Deltaproteobacteria bacterium]|nr:M3 family oligoendopeptidase [Deltaproteobacteria bacterium]
MTDSQKPPHWELDRLYVRDSASLKAELESLDTQSRSFMSYRERLSSCEPVDISELGQMIEKLEKVTILCERISSFAHLGFAADTSDQKALSFLLSSEEMLAKHYNDTIFFEMWWKNLTDSEAQPYMDALKAHSYWLSRMRAFRVNTLSEAEEKIINLKDLTGSESIVKLYDTITNSYRFRSDFWPDSDQRWLTREELSVHIRSHLPEVRAGAYQELYRVYAQDSAVLGQIYQVLLRDWNTEKVGLRKYPSPRAVRDKANDLAPQTVDSLLRVCRQKAPIVFGRYFKKKAQKLGLKQLRRYDLYAPLLPSEDTYTFPEGLDEVEKAFRSFDQKFADLAMNVPRERHLSAEIKPGKQSGAFCASTVPGEVPWVLMSYTGNRHDLFTLAHEFGHAVHSQLAADLSVFNFHSALPLAETASTMAEMILARSLRQKASSGPEIEDLNFKLLDDAYATVGRQVFFALFEVEAHEMVAGGATTEELAEAYYKNLAGQFGQSIELSNEFRWEWLSIPHFYHTPFYVYAYSFGQLLVYSLWRIYEREGAAFVPKFLTILSRGGSASPDNILAEAGLGPLDDDFWTGGFEVIESFLD